MRHLPMIVAAAFVASFVPLLAGPATAQTIRPADADRMARFDAILGDALAQALNGGSVADIDVLTGVLAGTPGPLAPAGDWNCRILKLGGLLPLTAYGNFRCRIGPAGPGTWRIEKLTGSQRFAGTIYDTGGEALYLGVGFVDGGPAVGYDGLPPGDQTPVEPGQTVAEIGVFEQVGPNSARLLLPDPILESDFNILWLTR